MVKKLYIYLLSIISILFSGCFSDKGNYDYAKKEVITVEGIEKFYSRVTGVDALTITPTVHSSEPGAKLTYKWEIFELVLGQTVKLETIATTKDLNYPIKNNAKKYVVMHTVTNQVTGYSHITTIDLQVVTEYINGWYILKDNGTKSDIDLFPTPTSITPLPTPRENIMLTVNGRQLEGKGNKLATLSQYNIEVPEKGYVKSRAFFALSEKDIFVTDITNMKIVRDVSDITYSALSPANPQLIFGAKGGMMDQFMLNDGQLHSIYNMSGNIGVFGQAKVMDEKLSPYRLSKYVIDTYKLYLMFDEISSSFVVGNSATSIFLTRIIDDPSTPIKANNNNLECLYMGVQDIASYAAPKKIYGVFRDKTTKVVKILAIDGSTIPTKFKAEVKSVVNAGDKLNQAELITLSRDENVIYFVAEGKVWSRNLESNLEKVEFTPASGEKITFLRHLSQAAAKVSVDYHYNYIVVGSNSAGTYNVRMFTKSAGSFSPSTPAIEFGGKGNCVDILHIYPDGNYNYDLPIY